MLNVVITRVYHEQRLELEGHFHKCVVIMEPDSSPANEHLKNNNAHDILRKVPLYNKFGPDFPREKLSRVRVPEFRLEPLQSSEEMFQSCLLYTSRCV